MRYFTLNEVLALNLTRKSTKSPVTSTSSKLKPQHYSTNETNNPLGTGLTCPYCASTLFVKNGKNNSTQRYFCKTCGRSFIELTNTVLYYTRKDLGTWTKFVSCMVKQFSLRRCAKELNISLNTAFYWRHKILDALREHSKTQVLHGEVTINDTHIRQSFKGNHSNSSFVLPRKPHVRGTSMTYQSISHEQVCILSALDNNSSLLMEPSCLGHIMHRDLARILVPVIKPHSNLITDNRCIYSTLCTKYKFNHTKVNNKPTLHCLKSVKNVNDLHKFLKLFLSVYRGVATKYLSNYLTLFKYLRDNKTCKFTTNTPICDDKINYLSPNDLILLLRGNLPYRNSNFSGRKTIFA